MEYIPKSRIKRKAVNDIVPRYSRVTEKEKEEELIFPLAEPEERIRHADGGNILEEADITITEPSRDENKAGEGVYADGTLQRKEAEKRAFRWDTFWHRKSHDRQTEIQVVKTPPRFRLLWGGIVAGLLGIGILAFFLSTVFAKLTVTVKPRIDTLPLENMTVTLDSAVSQVMASQKVLPAERLELNKKVSGEFQATGKEFIEDRARGKAKIYNRYSSTPQSLVASTRFMTDSGMIYRVPKNVTVPGAKIEEGKIMPQSIEVELVADKAGEEANASGEIELHIPGFKGSPKYDGFYATVSSGFAGGFRGEAQVVSKDDLKNAEVAVTKQAYDALRGEIIEKIPPGFRLLESGEEIKIAKVDVPRERSRADHFSVTAEAVSHSIIFRAQDVLSFLKDVLLKDDHTRQLIEDTNNVSYQFKNVDFEKGRATLVIGGNMKTKMVILTDELAALLKGKKEGSLIESLKGRKELASFRLTFFPFWLSRAPQDTGKIGFIVEQP